jgi:endoglucanase
MNEKFDPDISTGEYGDRSLNDEWFWSATELFVTTRDQKYFSVVNERMKDRAGLPSWNNVTTLGYYSFIRNEQKLKSSAPVIQMMKDTIVRIGNGLLQNQMTNAFSTVMGGNPREFVWGSNAVAANQGILLVYAYFITRDKNI